MIKRCQAFPYGSKSEPVTIDGDLYLPTIMTAQLYSKISHARSGDGYYWDKRPYLFIGDADETGFSFLLANQKDPNYFPEQQTWGWRPVLIPLTKNETPDDVLRQYNDGETVKAGTFIFLNKLAKPQRCIYDTETPNREHLKFGDSDGKNDLNWLVWKGVLVSCQDLAFCTTKDLAAMHLATYFDLEHLYD